MMKNSKLILAVVAVVLVVCLSIGSAWAYFTDYTTTDGENGVVLGGNGGIIEETVGGGAKTVSVKNTGEVPVFVRVKAFPETGLTYSGSSNWSPKNGYYEYANPVPVGQSTPDSLVIGYNKVLPGTPKEGDSVNVIVVFECTPVQYDENGNPYADWTIQAAQAPES